MPLDKEYPFNLNVNMSYIESEYCKYCVVDLSPLAQLFSLSGLTYEYCLKDQTDGEKAIQNCPVCYGCKERIK